MRENEGINHFQLASGIVRAEFSEDDRGGVQFRAKRNHLPLNKYRSGGHITPQQHRAGEKLYSLYLTSSHLHHATQARYGDDLGGYIKNFERKFEINEIYMAAIMSVSGGQCRDTVMLVCLDGLKCGRGKPMEYLKQGLNQLVDFFKVDNQRDKA
jgi:hypothetical protein